ncbi:MAG: ester cyclase [Acidobacteria bacterium]|nr:ester cyclase [Acidobacteriota bacterium]
MSETNKALVRRWTEEIWNQGRISAVDELAAADIVYHDPLIQDLQGPDALKQLAATLRAAFPDGRFSEDDLIEEGDKVVMRWTFRGTQKGEWIGVAATGSPEEITGTGTLRLARGKVAEHWVHWDALGFVQRAGTAATALIRRWIEDVLNKGNLDVVDEIFAEDAVFGATLIPEMRGPAAIKGLATAVRTAFPDIRYSLVGEPVVHGDRCAYRWTAGGTHKADFLGIAPTGRYVTHIGTATYRVRGGKIAELWGDWDALGVMQQLGAAPAVGQIKAAAAG